MGRRKRANPFSLFSFQDIITSVMGIMLLSALLLAVELTTRKATTTDAPSRDLVPVRQGLIDSVAAVRKELDQLGLDIEAATRNATDAAGQLVVEVPRRRREAESRASRLLADLDALQDAIASSRTAEDRLDAQVFDRRDDRERLNDLAKSLAEIEEELNELKQSRRMFFRKSAGMHKNPWVVDLSQDRIQFGALPQGPDGELSTVTQTFQDVGDLLDFLKAFPSSDNYFIVLVRPSGVWTYGEVVEKLHELGYQIGFDIVAEDQVVFAEGK